MEKTADDLFYKDYVAGYRDGLWDAHRGISIDPDKHISQLPLAGAAISARARNCLTTAGCTTVSDVASLREEAIATMRNLGPNS